MKKSILLALGLFAATAFAKDVPPDAEKPIPAKSSFDELVGEGQTDYASYNKAVRALKEAVIDRDTLKAQFSEVSNAAIIFKTQRNEMASQVMDLSAQVQLLRAEIDRLKQPKP